MAKKSKIELQALKDQEVALGSIVNKLQEKFAQETQFADLLSRVNEIQQNALGPIKSQKLLLESIQKEEKELASKIKGKQDAGKRIFATERQRLSVLQSISAEAKIQIKSGQEQIDNAKELSNQASDFADKMYDKTKIGGAIDKAKEWGSVLNKIPLVGGKLNKMFGSALDSVGTKIKSKLQDKLVAAGAEGVVGMEAFSAAGVGGLKAIKMTLMSIPIVGWILAAVAALTALVAMAAGADKHISEMAKSLSMSKAEAIELEHALHKSDKTTGELAVSMKNALPILSAWKTEMGSINTLSIEELKLLERTTFNLGLSAENVAKIAIVGKTSGKTAKETLTTINDTTNEYNKQNKLGFDIKDTLDDIANVSSNVQAMFAGNTEELTKQVLEARRLGTTLDKMQSTANNQLNIESSIGAQMEANVLTGARLNFDKAKGLGLAGDFAGMQDEILDQVESIANWDELSWKSKQKVAEASGMELGELQKSLTVRKLNSIVTDDMMDSLMKAEKARRNGIEGAEEELKQLKMKAGIEGDMAFDEALKEQSRASSMESFDRSIDLLKEKFTSKVANGMGKLLDQLAKAGEYLASGGSLTGLLFKDFSSDEEKEAKSKEAMANAKKSTDSGMRNAASQIESREKGESTIRVVTGMKAADGAMVKATPGGVHTIVAEAGQDEAVVPLTEFYAKLDHIVSAIKESSSSTQPQPVEVLVDFGDGPRERLFTRQKNVSRIGNNLGLG